jgi:hypothetical protein
LFKLFICSWNIGIQRLFSFAPTLGESNDDCSYSAPLWNYWLVYQPHNEAEPAAEEFARICCGFSRRWDRRIIGDPSSGGASIFAGAFGIRSLFAVGRGPVILRENRKHPRRGTVR